LKQAEESKTGDPAQNEPRTYFAIIQLERPILIQQQSLLIASKLDKDITNANKQCRLAFYGQVIDLIKDPEA